MKPLRIVVRKRSWSAPIPMTVEEASAWLARLHYFNGEIDCPKCKRRVGIFHDCR